MSIPEQCRSSLQKRDVVNDPRHQSPHTVKPYIDLTHGVKSSRTQICENVWALSTKIYNAFQERLSKYNGWCHWTCQTANAIQLVIICFMVLSLGLKHRHAVNNCVITVTSHERHGLTSPATWLFCSRPVLTSQVESNGILHYCRLVTEIHRWIPSKRASIDKSVSMPFHVRQHVRTTGTYVSVVDDLGQNKRRRECQESRKIIRIKRHTRI